ncbi:GH43 family beta-xylosidase [Mobilisporobacter senegalensis]|uniref:GH43 family beta-xylosidase n=1 Tax=Mobilisporobacter senegalensis TaxID=1329262 RepID=A0A3N1XPN6_9FIRM|nr:CBM35 domain-containing protein [Mobilisporobacter senegalensis]ROR28228.1 GH43 family beta-xylosidase [Mobilisporobacter senegalensis]
MRKKLLLFMLMVAMVITTLPPQAAQAEVASQYRNPLMRGADPTIARDADGFYYCGFATDNDIYLKRAETVLGISTAKSRLVWKKPENFGYVWGPYIYRMEGKWYIYFASGPETDFGYGHPSTYVLENESPDPFEGTWELKGSWSNRDENGEATEKAGLMNAEGYGLPCGVVTIGGERYYSYTKYFYYEDQYLGVASGSAIDYTRTKFDECPTIVKMLNPWTLDNGTVEGSTGTECTLARPIYDWEKHGDNIDEGCAVVEKDGKVYFAYSASSFMNDNYCVGVSYADLNSDLLDPNSWEKLPVPLMSKSPENSAFGPGSPLFVKSEDGTEDWLIHHAGPVGGQTGANRWVRATPVSWTDNSFVNVGVPSNPGTVFDRPSGEEKSEVLEAEDAACVGVEKRIISNSARSSGSGNVKFNEAGGYVEFDVEAESAGMYSLDFRYNNAVTGSAITMELSVNDSQQRMLSFVSNGEYTANLDVLKVYNIILQEGINKIRMTAPASCELILDALTIKKTTLYEAEEAALSGGAKTSTEHTGYSGSGYVDNLYTNGTGVAFTVDAPYTGNYSVDLRYCNGFYGEKINKSLAIYVNGVRVKTADCFYGTSWSDWQDRYDNLNLKQGVNTIEYRYDDASLGNVNIDYITVTEAVTMTYEAEQAELSGGASFAQDHAGYTGTGFVGGLWQDGALEFHIDVETAAIYDVSIKYALGFIGETRNMNLYINGESKGTINFSDSTGWDNWSEKVVAMELTEGINTIKLTREGAGQGDINLDNIHLQRRIPWAYQAENATMLGGAHKSEDHLWYEGTGFAGGFESADGTEGIEFTVNVPYTGTHTATLRYSGAHENNITMSLYVNGVRIKQIELPPTKTWDDWNEATYDVDLKAGDNTIKLVREITDSGCFNIDSLTIDKYSSAKSSLKNPGLVSGTVYVMKSKTSGKAADVAGYSRDAGALVNQWNYLGNINQLWELLDQGNGYWKLMSSYSGHMLDVADTSNYFTCQQINDPNSISQQWKIEQLGDFYKLTNRQYDMVLEVVDGLTSNGTMIRLAAYEEGADRQLWNIADGFDATGIKAEQPGEEEEPGGETPGGETPGGETPGGETPGGNTPGGNTPGGNTSGGDTSGGTYNPTKPSVPEQPDKEKEPEVKPQTEVTGKIKVGKTNNVLSWEKVEGATKYIVYACKTGSSKYTKIATINAGKKLSFTHKNVKGKSYKYYIQAYGKNDAGKTVKLMQSDTMQTISSKDKKTFYMTTNMKVAKINSTGEIIVVGSGDCTIYVYMPKGKIKKIDINIKK